MKRRQHDEDNGFGEHGGYMSAKINKLEEQFSTLQKEVRKTNLFEGISIFVNGRTNPSADDLKRIMLENGGIFHHYQRSHTKFVIASNLPDVKIRSNITKNIIKPEWIVDCLKENRLIDYSNYLLYTNKNSHQPQLFFKKAEPENEEQSFEYSLDSLNQKMQQQEKDVEKTGTAVDKNFLHEFLNNSRLHCISTMASSFKFYITDLRKKHMGIFPEREVLKTKLHQVENFKEYENVIMHIDMDCFFVSVGLRNKPHLKGKPVAVTHSKGKAGEKSDDFMSMSEIASCSYEARKLGLKNGMFVGQALKLCPDLQTIPYEFEEYRKTAYKLYDTVAKYTLDIEAVSCDELYADLTNALNECKVNLMEFVSLLRQEIFEQTSCTCSVGIGENRLQARMATKEAKPNGQYELLSTNISEYMKNKKIRDLPGVGYSTEHTLKQLNLETCGEIQEFPVHQLQHHFGKKFGETLLMMSKGIDEKKLNFDQVRKSVSVDVNYGIRFNDDEEVKPFLKQVCEELSKRLVEIEKKGKCVTIKIMMRAKNASAISKKFLGYGEADKVSKQVQLSSSTNDAFVIFQHALSLLKSFNIPAHDLRGIGVQVSKLDEEQDEKSKGKLVEMFKKMSENQDAKKVKVERIKLEPNVSRANLSPPKRKQRTLKKVASSSNVTSVADLFTAKKSSGQRRKYIDPDVLAELPPDIVEEILRDYDTNEEVEQQLPEEPARIVEPKAEPQETVTLANNFFMDDAWRSTIIEWIENNPKPASYMTDIMGGNLVELIRAKNLELPFLIMRFLHRHAENSNRDWQDAYNTIESALQEEMKKNFNGRKLSVPEIF